MKFYWNKRDWDRARRMRDAGKSDAQIARAVGLTEKQVHNKFVNHGCKHSTTERMKDIEPRLVERDARIAAYDRRNPTQVFFGDPPIGFSELDKKNGKHPT